MGTWNWPESGAAAKEAARALHIGIELGLTHIDTAEMYGAGRVEEILGDVLAGVPRSSVFLTSKVLPANASFEGTIAACERTLRRLRTEYLDLYLLHWRSAYPIEQTMGAMERLVEDGKVRSIGVSNFDLDDLRSAQAALRRQRIAANQVLYHLNERGMERRVLPYCREQGIALIGYTPFGRSRYPRREAAAGGILQEIAQAHGASAREVILNFLTRERGLYAIPKASRIAHVRENAATLSWQLDAVDIESIDRAFPVSDGPLATL